MRRSVRMSDFAKMTEAEMRATVADLSAAARARPNGEAAELEMEIRSFERRYEMTSQQMRERLNAGLIQETEDVCHWVIALELRELTGGVEARS